MEKNLTFDIQPLSAIHVHLAWAQLEIFGDDVEKIQVMAAGDDGSVNDLRIENKQDTLVIEQPQYGLSLNLKESKWLQICIRVPRSWEKEIKCNTISGLLRARKLHASALTFETVSGDLRAVSLTAPKITLKTVSGDTRGEDLSAEKLNVRSVSGDTALDALDVETLKCNSVSGEQTYNMLKSFHSVDVTAVSGNVIITAPVEAMNISLRSISGRVRTEGVNICDDPSAPSVRITGVSADLKLISIME